MTKLELLRTATDELANNSDQRHAFEDYFIGALSLNVSETVWTQAIDAARRCYAVHHPADKTGGEK
jgi:hypothetical protein